MGSVSVEATEGFSNQDHLFILGLLPPLAHTQAWVFTWPRGPGPPLAHCPGAHSGTSGHHGPWGSGLWSPSSPRRSGVGYMQQASANVLLTKLGLSGLKCLFILLRHRIIVCLESPYPCFLCDLYYLASNVCPGYIGRQNCPSLPSLCLQAPCIFVSCVVNLRLRSSPDSLALLVAQKSEQLLYCLWP